jgi:hypothetical protein
MSDFLGSLVQRSLPTSALHGAQTALAPRLPSLFEPPGGDLAAPEPAPPAPAEQPAPPPAVQEPDRQGPSPTLMASPAPSNPSLSATRRAAAGAMGPTEPERGAKAAGAPERAAPAPFRPQIITHQPSGAVPAEAPPLPPQNPQLLPIPLQPTMSPPGSFAAIPGAADIAASDRRKGSGAPTVRIHIGRIEVRAVHSPPAEPTSPRGLPRPKLSLDDYRKRRSEGKR